MGRETMRVRPILVGMATCLPGANRIYRRWKKSSTESGTHSAKYCYNVWLKHLTLLWQAGLREIPDTVGELGPGSSLGVGISALLSGVKSYYALDVLRYADVGENLRIFDELVSLFVNRTGWCADQKRGWPDITEYLDSNAFPSDILTDELLAQTLSRQRLEHIRWSLEHLDEDSEDSVIKYYAPWASEDVAHVDGADLIVSQSVLEHVADLDETYRALGLWVKQDGWMSHQIDFSAHGLTREWNGHWRYPDWAWKLVLGQRPFLINRQPCSAHIQHIERNGFSIVRRAQRSDPDKSISRSQLRGGWQRLSSSDFSCRGLILQAQKTGDA